ncbi:hypothetical protein ACFL54_00645 [Planctomycetota bacterium]
MNNNKEQKRRIDWPLISVICLIVTGICLSVVLYYTKKQRAEREREALEYYEKVTTSDWLSEYDLPGRSVDGCKMIVHRYPKTAAAKKAREYLTNYEMNIWGRMIGLDEKNARRKSLLLKAYKMFEKPYGEFSAEEFTEIFRDAEFSHPPWEKPQSKK